MAQTLDIPFPNSSMPGQRPGEGQGRLINTFCELDGTVPTWKAVPGLRPFGDTVSGHGPRGMFVSGERLYAAMADGVFTAALNGAVSRLSGAAEGIMPVTFAQNNRAPVSDIILVTETDVFLVTNTAVLPLDSPILPQPTSVSQLDGYFLFTIADGRLFASDLNSTNIQALSFTTCQADPDGLLRGFAWGSQFYACGPSSIEVYSDVGTQPFPLARQAVIPVGLIGPWAVAGFGSGWDQGPFLIAGDGTVRQISGYTAPVVSTKDVDRAIQSVTDKTTIRASVHTVAGHPTLTISSPDWTWEYNVSTKFWHERRSFGMQRWRGETSAKFGNRWIVGDILSSKLQEVTEDAFDEDGSPLTMTLESGAVKQFPAQLMPYTGWFDWTTGQGNVDQAQATVAHKWDEPGDKWDHGLQWDATEVVGNEQNDAIFPVVSISTSRDGGGSWGADIQRSIGAQGEYAKPVRVNRISGRTTQHGLRVRNVCSSAVYRSFRGGRLTVDQRAPV